MILWLVLLSLYFCACIEMLSTVHVIAAPFYFIDDKNYIVIIFLFMALIVVVDNRHSDVCECINEPILQLTNLSRKTENWNCLAKRKFMDLVK